MSLSSAKKDLESFFPVIMGELVEAVVQTGVAPKVVNRFVECAMTMCLGGKMYRSAIIPEMGRFLSDQPLSDDAMRDLKILAWVVEIWQGYILIVDDMIDGTPERRGQPSWHVRQHVGSIAANEAALLKSVLFVLLKNNFIQHPAYHDMVESIHDISFGLEIGQEWDALASKEHRPGEWSLEIWDRLVALKAGNGSFVLPVLLTLQYFGLGTPENLRQARMIAAVAGKLYQLRNDFSDISRAKIQKFGFSPDIQEGKCSWVIVTALRECQEEDAEFLNLHYGTKDTEMAKKIQSIFDSLPLESLFRKKEEEMVASLKLLIEEVNESSGLKKAMFHMLLDTTFT